MSCKLPGLSYCGDKVPELQLTLASPKKKSLLGAGHLCKSHPAQWIRVQKVVKKWLCEHSLTQTLWGVLKSPGGISSGKLFCTSQPVFRFQVSSLNALPLPQPQASCSDPRKKNCPWNQTQQRSPLAPRCEQPALDTQHEHPTLSTTQVWNTGDSFSGHESGYFILSLA